MNYKLILLLSIILFSLPLKAKAFLPPEFFVQGIASIMAIIAGGVAFAFLPIVLFFRSIKRTFKKYKKIIIFLLIQNIAIAIILGLVFYYRYYRPLYEDSYLFPKESSQIINPLDRQIEPFDPTDLKDSYIVVNGVIRADEGLLIDHAYGIEPKELNKELIAGRSIYYLDIRESEEFSVGHALGAKHIRHADIESVKTIKNLFGLNKESFKKALIVVYCHDGDRGFYTAKNLDQENIKYLIGGVEGLQGKDYIEYTGAYLSDTKIFPAGYQRMFQISARKASEMITEDKNIFIVDMRLGRAFAIKHIKGSLHFLFNTMPTEEYKKRLQKVLKHKDKNIIFIVERYTELFYANLLIMRLEQNYHFDRKKFHVLFAQFHILEKNPNIKFESGYPQV